MSLPPSSPRPRPLQPSLRQGAALVIVLAFVVLLTGVVVAFFSRSLSERQISNSSANQTRIELFTQGATDTVLGDLEQEIAAGSTVVSPASGVNVYVPRASLSAVPNPVGTPSPSSAAALKTGMAGLIKRSAYNYSATANNPVVGPQPFYANPLPLPASTPYDTANYPPSKRAAPVSTLFASLNGRSISPARWNKHLLLEKASAAANGGNDSNNTDFAPVGAPYPTGTPPPTAAPGSPPTTWVDGANNPLAPDWVLVARDGTNPTAWNTNMATSRGNASSVVSRYAYAVYDEGGLLDVNAAGFPLGAPPATGSLYSTSAPANFDPRAAYKSGLSFADLSQLPGFNSLSLARQQGVINSLVGWRNYASAKPNGALSPGMAGFDFTVGNPLAYVNFTNAILGNTSGFLRTNNSTVVGSQGGQSDRLFSSRQALINLLLQGIAANGAGSATEQANIQNALQYLGTFSRGINQPSYSFDKTSPLVLAANAGGNTARGYDGDINPGKADTAGGIPPYPAGFLSIVVQTPFQRNDGISAVTGEPLVKRRFALSRLAWLTSRGPVADDSGNLNPASDSLINAEITQLENLGVPKTLLQQGGPKNILNYFGLAWNGNLWVYSQHLASTGAIARVGVLSGATAGTGPREPDFFELLKAGINVGSLGKSITNQIGDGAADSPGYTGVSNPVDNQYKLDSNPDYQIMQTGVNIIEQANVAGYPIRIALGSGSSAPEFDGIENLPYLYHVHYGVVQIKKASPTPPTNTPPYAVAITPAQAMTLTNGTGALLQIPTLWNPHDNTLPRPVPVNGVPMFPTKFRLLVDSADVVNGGSYDNYYLFGVASNAINGSTITGLATQSYHATTPIPTAGYTGRTSAQALTAANTEMDFTVDPTVASSDLAAKLFREPTPLCQQGYANLVSKNGLLGSGLITFNSNPFGESSPPENIASFNLTGVLLGTFPLCWISTDTSAGSSTSGMQYAMTAYSAQCARVVAGASSEANDDTTNCFLTYRLQCQDSTGAWVDYDTRYVSTFMSGKPTPMMTGNTNGTMSFQYNGTKGILMGAPVNSNIYTGTSGFFDPRTSRFGMLNSQSLNAQHDEEQGTPGPESANNGNGGAGEGGSFPTNRGRWSHGFTDCNNVVLTSDRPDQSPGYPFWYLSGWGTNLALSTSGWYLLPTSTSAPLCIRPGLYSQNDPDYDPTTHGARFLDDSKPRNASAPAYYGDADGVVRRAMGAYVRTGTNTDFTGYFTALSLSSSFVKSTTIGLPMARALPYVSQTAPQYDDYTNNSYPPNGIVPDNTKSQNQMQSRPVILHRPFRTVGELGYTFTGSPWKNLDFFTPESGDAALLDLFCVNDTDDPNGLVAGKVNLNTHQTPVLQAVLANAYKDEDRVARV